MAAQTLEKLQTLQGNPKNIRNICILAHVDHGKTTLADALVASNGIISPRMVGKLRYMDSREDEQQRGITMKSSAIALHFEDDGKDYLINLIDSPGHVDFSSEVSTAVRLCDGALVVVDVVEGVCPQTHVVLKQAWQEGIRPVLVLTKMDRLIVEKKLTPTEAYAHLQQVLEQVNAVTGSLFTSEVMESLSTTVTTDRQKPTLEREDTSIAETNDSGGEAPPSHEREGEGEVVYDWSAGLDERDDSSLYFYPDQGNIVFASAIDGWGFSLHHFADIYAKRLGVRADVLRKTLWGDFYLNAKAKRIYKGAQARGKKPLFVQFVLENLWAVYDAVLINRNKEKIDKITSSLKLKVSVRDSKMGDPRAHVFAICSQWLPLARAVLEMVTRKLPSPLEVSEARAERLMCDATKTFDSLPPSTQALKKAFTECNSLNDAPVIVYVSKMFPVPKEALPDSKSRPLTLEEIHQRHDLAKLRAMAKTAHAQAVAVGGAHSTRDAPEENPIHDNAREDKDELGVIFLAFARIFSGTLHKDQTVFMLHPRHDPRTVACVWSNQLPAAEDIKAEGYSDPLPEHVDVVTVSNLYVLMGRSVEAVNHVSAGNIVGIGGLEGVVLKSATLSTTIACPAFRQMSFAATPIVQVAVEPHHPTDMQSLREGMTLLNQADPCVKVTISETGEHLLATAGEVHLQRCLDDLRTTYAKVKLNVSAPIIPFRETVVPPPKVDTLNEAISNENEIKRMRERDLGAAELVNDEGTVSIVTPNRLCSLEIQAIPLPEKVTQLLDENREVLRVLSLSAAAGGQGGGASELSISEGTLTQLSKLKEDLSMAFAESGPGWEGTVEKIWSFGPRLIGANILLNEVFEYKRPSIWSILEGKRVTSSDLWEFDNSVVNGFQLATLAGPLCEEPMYGVCLAVRKWTVHQSPVPLKASSDREESEDTVVSVSERENECEQKAGRSEGDVPPLLDNSAQKSVDVSYTALGGQLISAVKEGCRKAFMAQPVRLMAAMYKCKIQATSDVLGRVYGVLGKRQGRVITEEMKEGSNIFEIDALVPVAESFGFAEEIRKKASGLASPQLVFSHWETIPMDPFWVPSTEEELMHFGEKADSENVAQKYMNMVRKRKGLHVEEKIVEHAEKQRTLKK